MTAPAYPVDSTEAAELRERAALEVEHVAEHAPPWQLSSRSGSTTTTPDAFEGWLDDADADHPTPCLVCRPTLGRVACRACGEHPAHCAFGIGQGRGSCCGTSCNHARGGPQ
jgi:hypothetical protein